MNLVSSLAILVLIALTTVLLPSFVVDVAAEPPYQGPVLLASHANTVVLLSPDDGSSLLPSVTFLGGPSTTVQALAADGDSRLYYALVTNSTATWVAQLGIDTGLAQNSQLVTLPVTVPFGRCGLAYSPGAGLVAVFEQVQSTAYFINFTALSYAPKSIVAQYPADIAIDDVGAAGVPTLSLIDYISSVLHFSDINNLGGDIYYNYINETQLSAVSFDSVANYFVGIGENLLFPVSAPFGSVTRRIPFGVAGSVPGRVVSFSDSSKGITIISTWEAYPGNLLNRYTFDLSNLDTANQDASLTQYNVSGLAYMPVYTNLQPVQPAGSTTTATFGKTPEFAIANSGSGNKSEATTPSYGAFKTPQGNSVAFPTTWAKDQAALMGGSGTSTDGTTVTSLENVNGTTYSYSWASTVANQPLSITSLYNPFGNIQVTSPQGLSSVLAPGAVKFSLYLSGSNVSSVLFGGDTAATLTWSTCFDNDEKLGRYNLGMFFFGTQMGRRTSSVVLTTRLKCCACPSHCKRRSILKS
eukprot:TRINITY_DN2301_c0_g2_i9.p1 TRINITY_DN2301_c0_g2~~TRINITY_DN2301_c0_g2_i9.p1  ORF type:complete len:526 (+),score=54.71 TRINITY_DN2301_c0_g2_i9:54-1631(+)